MPAVLGLLALLAAAGAVVWLGLRLRQMRFAQAAIDSVGCGYWILNAKAEFVDVNAAYCRMVGYPRAQVLSMRIADFEAVATQDRIAGQVQRILQFGQQRFETRHRKRNGDWVDLEVTVTPASRSQLIVYLRDISERKQAADEINRLALYDPLTALPNRRLLQDRIRQVLLQTTRSAQHGALLFIDLDHFKRLNDSLGHATGDQLLRQVAQRLVLCVREGDTVARFGGDEFVVLLAQLHGNAHEAAAEVRAIGHKILATLGQAFQLDQVEHYTTASIGAALFCSAQLTPEDVLKQADLAMYKSKAAGRNALHFFDPAMQVAIEARTRLEADLRVALRESQFELLYHPQANADKAITGAEALVRWKHPALGLLMPADFMPLAEESGLIVPLGQWVLETACLQLAQWGQQPETAHLVLAVNVSAKQMRQADFVEQVLATLQCSGADPHKLQFELTEGVLVSGMDDVLAKMRALKAHGICFSLDDFGTGYSSLGYLSRLPIDQLKIDRSFVSQIEVSENALSICVAVIGLARSLRMSVVAEGVATEAQLYLLAIEHQCQYVQGDAIAMPLSASAFQVLLSSDTRAEAAEWLN